MSVTLLVKFRIKDIKTTELGLLLQVLPVRIITFVETLGSHLNFRVVGNLHAEDHKGYFLTRFQTRMFRSVYLYRRKSSLPRKYQNI